MASEEHPELPLLPGQGTDHLDENIEGMPAIIENNEDTLITPATLTNPAVTSASEEAIAHQVVAANEQHAAGMMGDQTHETVVRNILGEGLTEQLPGADIKAASGDETVPNMPYIEGIEPPDATTKPVAVPPGKGEVPGNRDQFIADATNAGLANDAPPPSEDQ